MKRRYSLFPIKIYREADDFGHFSLYSGTVYCRLRSGLYEKRTTILSGGFFNLPEAIKKTIRVKELLKDGSCASINEAVHKVNMSRSAYYKYKDHVASADDDKGDRVVVLLIIMQDDMAVFGRILRRIAREKQEILSVNRTKISEKLYSSVITLKTKESADDIESLYESLKEIKGIQSLTMKLGGEFK